MSESSNISEPTTTKPLFPSSSSHSTSITSKLSDDNYHMWISQVLPQLRGHQVLGYVDGSTPCPPRFLIHADGSIPTLNPAYDEWQRQDQLLLSWLISSLSVEVHAQVIGLSTSHDVWTSLETSYAAHSRARVLQLRMELQSLKKGPDSIQKYFQRAKTFAHQLALAGRPVCDEDLILSILAGLPSEYGPFRTSISTREEAVSMSDLLGYLLTEEFRIHHDAAPIDAPPAANVIVHASSPPIQTTRGYNPNRSRGSRFRGRGRGRQYGHSRSNTNDSSSSPSIQRNNKEANLHDATHWHLRLGHPAFRTVRHILEQLGTPISSNKDVSICDACQKGKSHALPFPSTSTPADSLHSGSISFGRFETESLSWERRSSFSHNRYLEEVEKYSTPGSVTQKKAYFEAHFKKKALLRQASSECQNGMEYQTSENDVLDQMSYIEEFDHANDGSHFSHYGESPDGSDYHRECEVMEYERIEELSPSESQIEPTLTNTEAVLDDALQNIKPEEMHQNQFECEKLKLVKEEHEIEVKQKLADDTEHVDGLLKATDQSPKSRLAEEDDGPSLIRTQKNPLKVKAIAETKSTRPKMKLPVTVAKVPKNLSSEASKDSAKISRRMERENPLKMKPEKRSPHTVLPTTCFVPRTLKLEIDLPSQEPENLKAKLCQEGRSEKDLRAKKVITVPQPFATEEGESRAHQTANRDWTRKTYSFVVVAHLIQFYMKLEEKMHAKEVEMNQIQAKTQEETEAEMRQFRRSLNFKATPMPSFYLESVSRGSDGKKVVSAQEKSTKLLCKSTSPGSKAATRSPTAFSKAGNQQDDLSASKYDNATAQPKSSKATGCPIVQPTETGYSFQTTSTNRNRTPHAGKKNEAAGKKEKEKGKNNNVQKQQGSECNKVKKGDRVEGRRMVGGVGKSSSEMVRKVMKSVSGMGSLTINVAS
ncbi:hypothetical protein HHK36_006807 [Tetracentron sinense]|uniref:TPX2 C-terminal domain-containing protein n=1 Tax=Tetracentron sinense TaxID=13715 RepID=A0A835DPJ8_TETSI|nr:hypothetical protein HHK36_006807 [Tetracentron sinense]